MKYKPTEFSSYLSTYGIECLFAGVPLLEYADFTAYSSMCCVKTMVSYNTSIRIMTESVFWISHLTSNRYFITRWTKMAIMKPTIVTGVQESHQWWQNLTYNIAVQCIQLTVFIKSIDRIAFNINTGAITYKNNLVVQRWVTAIFSKMKWLFMKAIGCILCVQNVFSAVVVVYPNKIRRTYCKLHQYWAPKWCKPLKVPLHNVRYGFS